MGGTLPFIAFVYKNEEILVKESSYHLLVLLVMKFCDARPVILYNFDLLTTST
jgi:hypothetical protein